MSDDPRAALLDILRAERDSGGKAPREYWSGYRDGLDTAMRRVEIFPLASPPHSEGPLDGATFTATLAALADVTAAYHHERGHGGHWSKCQHRRCQNARLAAEGRGPFVAALSKGAVEQEEGPLPDDQVEEGEDWKPANSDDG